MNRHLITRVFHFAGIAAIVFALTLLPMLAQQVGANSLASTPAEVGFIDHTYGGGVKIEPTADVSESKLWFNDGIWWGILFNPDSALYEIYRLEWDTQTWVTTGMATDSRYDTSDIQVPQIDPLQVATRADVLWDSPYLYVATHIRTLNPASVNAASTNKAQLSRYTYQQSSQTYLLDPGFPVDVNSSKTKSMVFDKDASGRLWVTYVSRLPSDGDPLTDEPYRVFVNASTSNEYTWGVPLDLSTIAGIGAAATVARNDISAVIPFTDKIGVMWSNDLDGKFYFAVHENSSPPNAGWSITEVTVPGVPLISNDHIKMVVNSSGEVFVALKTSNTIPGEPLTGVLARQTNGTFTFHSYSPVESLDTRPSLVLNESENKLYMFVASNASGGVICVKEMDITPNLADMQFPVGSCSTNPLGSAPHFLVSSLYENIDNVTTSKRPVSIASGLVALASDNGTVYLHNFIGGPLPPEPVVTGFSPVNGAQAAGNIVTVTVVFNQPMDVASLTTANFQVLGPGGALPGTISYNSATRTAVYTATTGLAEGNHTINVNLTTDIRDATGRALSAAASWSFTQQVEAQQTMNMLFLPITVR